MIPWIERAEKIGETSTCDRGKIGCIIVLEDFPLVYGFPFSSPACDDVGHEMDESGKHCLRTIHAEQMALMNAAKLGISVQGAILYVNRIPCYTCAKLILCTGIEKVIAKKESFIANQRSQEILGDKLEIV